MTLAYREAGLADTEPVVLGGAGHFVWGVLTAFLERFGR